MDAAYLRSRHMARHQEEKRTGALRSQYMLQMMSMTSITNYHSIPRYAANESSGNLYFSDTCRRSTLTEQYAAPLIAEIA